MPQATDLDGLLTRAEQLYDLPTVQRAIAGLAQALSVLAGSQPLVLTLMNGGQIFAGQLLPLLPFALQCDYVQVSRYNHQLKGGALDWKRPPEFDLAGRSVLLLDDILDEGITLQEVASYCQRQHAAEVHTCVLTQKFRNGLPIADFKADFVGLPLPDRYVFGCGLDYQGFWRNAPGIYALKET